MNLNQDLRIHLQRELTQRCEKNRGYSLRAFARDLNIYHATLSALLTGKRPLTVKSAKKICEALNMSPVEMERFIGISAIEGAKKEETYRELSMDIFIVTSEWYYDALLELTHLKIFKPDPRWIARTLGISINEVNIAVERLQRLQLLRIEKNKWIDVSRSNTMPLQNDFTTAALQKYQRRILELSLESITQVDISQRCHSSMTVAVQKSDMAEAKKRITKFRRDLTAYLERNGAKPDAVYQIAVSFFPLTKNQEGDLP